MADRTGSTVFGRPYRTAGNSVDRNHQPKGRGIGLVTPIYQACLEWNNIHFLWNTRADNLLVVDDRVVGIETFRLRDKTTEPITADMVILATGGFQNNLQMVREFWPQEFKFSPKDPGRFRTSLDRVGAQNGSTRRW